MHRLVVVLVLFAGNALAQDSCVTSENTEGVCIEIRTCSSLFQLLKGPRPLSAQVFEVLRKNQCGFDGIYPKVCCENQNPVVTPESSAASPSVDVREPTLPLDEVPDPPDVTNHPNLRLLPHDVCGPVTQTKIVGGNKTGVFDFPWMALIAYSTGSGTPEFRCGGSLISKRYVLTAAHCVTELPQGLRLLGVRIGEHDINKERDCDLDENGAEIVCAERYQDFLAESVITHPEYTSTALQNDIALIRMNGDADLRPSSVRPICLPIGTASTLSHTKVTVTGWGATELGPRSQDLLRVHLSLVSTEDCGKAYGNRVQIWHKQICAGGKRNMDSCLGDSGGPLQAPGIYNKTKLRYVQYGIVSYGLRSCGVEGVPGVYTRVAYYMDWILNSIRE